MLRCLHDRCLLLFHSSYLVVLLPPPVIRARVGDGILNFCILLVALVTLDSLCLNHVCDGFGCGVDVGISSVSNRFLNSSWN